MLDKSKVDTDLANSCASAIVTLTTGEVRLVHVEVIGEIAGGGLAELQVRRVGDFGLIRYRTRAMWWVAFGGRQGTGPPGTNAIVPVVVLSVAGSVWAVPEGLSASEVPAAPFKRAYRKRRFGIRYLLRTRAGGTSDKS